MTNFGFRNLRQFNHEIYSNYKCNFAKRVEIMDILRIPFTNMERQPKTIMIHEADKWFDSRKSSRNENVLLSSFAGQAGKRNLDVYFDCQFLGRVDKYLREIPDFIIEAIGKEVDNNDRPTAFSYNWLDCYRNNSGSFVVDAKYLEPFYSAYDSFEPSEPLVESRSMKKIVEEIQTRKRR